MPTKFSVSTTPSSLADTPHRRRLGLAIVAVVALLAEFLALLAKLFCPSDLVHDVSLHNLVFTGDPAYWDTTAGLTGLGTCAQIAPSDA